MRFTRRRLSTRWRMTLWVMAIVSIVAFVGGLITLHLVERRFVDNIDHNLRDTSAGIMAAIDVLDVEAIELIRDNPDLQGLAADDTVALILSADGVEFSLPAVDAAAPEAFPDLSTLRLSELQGRAEEPFEMDGGPGRPDFRVLTRQLPDGTLLMTATSLDQLERALDTLGGVFVLVALVAAVVLSVIVSWVAGYVTRPIDGMIATAERVGSGALDTRVPVDGVDDVARLATAVNAMLDRLEVAFADRAESEEKLRRFVADASHELRTPLAAILGYAQLVQSGMASDPQAVDDAVGRIATEGERMRLLVEELLMLARLDHGRSPERRPLDLGAIVTAAVDDARTLDPDRSVALAIDDGDHTIAADGADLRRAVDNLLSNARTHTPPGTHITVTVAADPVDRRVVVHVDDDGPGLDPGDEGRVFDRFYRSERSRSRSGPTGGSGLGLSIVQAIAAAHDGAVGAGRSPGGGARFTLSFPAAPAGPTAVGGRDGVALDAP